MIEIWTDGSCINKDGTKGGYGILIKYADNNYRQWCGGSYINSSSSRQEIRAIVKALEKIEPGNDVIVYSDNEYCVNAVEKKWIWKWQNNNFIGKKNADLWKEFLNQNNRLRSRIKLKWVRGHSGIPENELVDALARLGADRKTIIKDRRQ